MMVNFMAINFVAIDFRERIDFFVSAPGCRLRICDASDDELIVCCRCGLVGLKMKV